MVDINKCRFCKAKLHEIHEEHFFYCSPECKEKREELQKEKDVEYIKMHDSKINKPKTEGELRALRCGAPTSEKPRTRPKGKRKCGKCGMSGHNARTCTAKNKDGTVPIKASSPLGYAKKKRNLNTCGKCGGKGHNARTCGKRQR